MDENLLEDIYDSLIGSLIPEAAVPWVEDAYAPGSKCDRLYGEMIEAYWRICDRLGKDGEDDDGEIMINNLLEIQRELCKRMFRLGMTYQKMLDEGQKLPEE